MAKSGKGYLNLGLMWLINVILAIIPVTSWLLGGITRIMRGHWIIGLLQLLLIGEVILWIVDMVTVIISGDLRVFAEAFAGREVCRKYLTNFRRTHIIKSSDPNGRRG